MMLLQYLKNRSKHASFWRKPWIISVGAIIIFSLIGLAAYWPVFLGDPTRLPGCVCGDPAQSSWFLRWTPYAISHSLNPFFTNWVNVPYGANLGQNTLMPLLGILTAPLSILVSPVASFNLLAWLAFPLSAGSMFYVLRRLTGSSLAAFVAGLLYGFSPYMVGQAAGHIMLSFIPLPPLIMLTVWEMFVEQRSRSLRLGIVLAIEVVTQFLISPEVLAITAIMISLGILVILITRFPYFTRERLIYATKSLTITAIVAGICLAYPIWFMVFGPQHFTGPNFPPDNPYRSDLIGLVVPTLNERFVPPVFHKFASETADGNYPETGDYIGLPLLLLICVSVVRWRRNRWLMFSAVLAFIAWVLSLGPRLVVNGTLTSIHLPFAVLVHLPLLKNIIPSRLSLGEWIFVPIIIALGIAEWQRDQKKKTTGTARWWTSKAGLILLAIAIIVTLLPRWPYPSQRVHVPAPYAAKSRIIPEGAIVLNYPFPLFPPDQAMLWQATNGMRFKLLGGYIQNLGPTGNQSLFPVLLSPPAVQEWLAHEQATNTPWPAAQSATANDIRSYLLNNNVGVVVIDPHATNAASVAKAFSTVLGPPKSLSDTLIWTNVQSHIRPH